MNTYVKATAKALLEEELTGDSLLAALEMCLEYGMALALFSPESGEKHLDNESRVHIAKSILRQRLAGHEDSEPLIEQLLNFDRKGFPLCRLEPKSSGTN